MAKRSSSRRIDDDGGPCFHPSLRGGVIDYYSISEMIPKSLENPSKMTSLHTPAAFRMPEEVKEAIMEKGKNRVPLG